MNRVFISSVFLTAIAIALPCGAQIFEDGDILWEAQWNDFATSLGEDPLTYDLQSNGVPDAWELAFAEAVIAQTATRGHYTKLIDIFNTNLSALESENADFHARFGLLAVLLICRGHFTEVDFYSQNPSELGGTWSSTDLDDTNYEGTPEVYPANDVDGDRVANENESGSDRATYIDKATTPRIGYSLDVESEVDLLNAAYYNGGQRSAWFGALNNAGTTVAFHSVDYTLPSDGEAFETEIYLVELGDPSSWRPLTTDYDEIPQSRITWSPDDSTIFVDNESIDAETGDRAPLEFFGYTIEECQSTNRPDGNYLVGQDFVRTLATIEFDFIRIGSLQFEFDQDGNAEDWFGLRFVTNVVVAEGNFAGEIEDASPPPIVSNLSLMQPAENNETIHFRMKYPVELKGQFGWDRSNDAGFPHRVEFAYTTPGEFQDIVIDLSGNSNYSDTIVRVMIEFVDLGRRQAIAVPIDASGSEDATREPIILTNFGVDEYVKGMSWPYVSPSFSALAFADYGGNGPGLTDHGDIWLVQGIDEIITAPKIPGTDISSLAPTSFDDPRVRPLRVEETDNFVHTPAFSQDGSIVFLTEDFNNVFTNPDFFNTIANADFDLIISPAAGYSADFQPTAPGSQFVPCPTPGGTRVLYISPISDGLDIHLLASQLEVCTLTEGTSQGLVDTDGDLQADAEQVITDIDQEATDASGTMVSIPAATTINFPIGAEQEIVIETPLSPVEEPQIPQGVDAIPVVRDFGPDGTTFDPPLEVTITYIDQEVAGLDEATLSIFLFNDETEQFDLLPEERIVSRDPANNKITFTAEHFSVYAVGGAEGGIIIDDPDDDEPPEPGSPDVDENGKTEAVDIQLVINAALGLITLPAADISRDGILNAADVQLVINAVLGV